MKYRKFTGVLLILGILLSGITVRAEKSNYSVAEAYTTGTQTTLFMRNAEGLLFSTANSTEEGSRPESLADAETERYFVFLVDNTGSMRKYKNQVTDVIRQVSENQSGNFSGVLLPFWDTVHPNSSESLDWQNGEKLLQEAEALTYEYQATNPYLAVTDALTLIDNCFPGDGDDLVSLVLITDGEPIWPGWVKEVGAYVDEAEKRVAEASEVMLFTVSLKKWTSEPVAPAITGRGIELLEGEENPGKMIADYCNSLSVLKIGRNSEEGERSSLQLFCKTEKTALTVQNIPTFRKTETGWTFSAETVTESEKETAGSQAEEAETQETEISENPGQSEAESVKETEPGKEAESAKETESAKEAERDSETEQSEAIREDDTEMGIDFRWLIAGGCLVLCLVLLIVLLAVRAKKASRKKPAAVGLPIILQVQSGNLRNGKDILYLNREMWVGSGADCEIRFTDPGVEEKNTRIFTVKSEIYIEDNDSLQGTAVNGNRLYATVKLKSGDLITIGVVSFRLKF